MTLEELNELISTAPANSMLGTHVTLSATDAGRASACIEHYAKDVARYQRLCEIADVTIELGSCGLVLSGQRDAKYFKQVLDGVLDALIEHKHVAK